MTEHAVIVRLDSPDLLENTDEVYRLCDQLEAVLDKAGAGELDGHEFGSDGCTVFMYGPDAAALYQSVESYLAKWTGEGHVIQRFGEAGDPNARTVRVDFPSRGHRE